MPKNIVICSDGTGNTTIKGRGTNVFKIYEAVDLHGHLHDPQRTPQVAFYDDGVGTERLKLVKLIAGAFGWGLSRNVKQLYAELVRVYEPGDRIYMFGFSRGAFTVRTLAGFIAACGIIKRSRFKNDAELWEAVEEGYRGYRRKYRTFLGRRFRQPYTEEWASQFRERHSVAHDQHAPSGKIPIEFIGVWDTVDAAGLPFDELADFINLYVYRFKFPDTKLSPRVKKACHAIAIDDERHTFHPVMWDEEGEKGGRIEQVWFPGVHSNVGGGYPKQGMSLVSLSWMMMKAELAGLRFVTDDKNFYHDHQNVSDKLYDSRAGLAVYYRYLPRDIAELCGRNHTKPKIHISAMERIVQDTEGYAPGNIPRDHEIVLTEARRSNLPGITQTIQNALGRHSSLLERVRFWVGVRRFSYHAFLGLSVLAIYRGLSEEIARSGLLNALFRVFSGGGFPQFARNLLYEPLLPALIVLFYAIGWWSARRMKRVFSEFWVGLLPTLKTIL